MSSTRDGWGPRLGNAGSRLTARPPDEVSPRPSDFGQIVAVREGDLAHARDDSKSRLHDPLRPNSVDQPFGGVLALSRAPLDNGGHATQCDSLLDFVPVLTSDPGRGGSATGVSQGLRARAAQPVQLALTHVRPRCCHGCCQPGVLC
jgi:hypothetical protein